MYDNEDNLVETEGGKIKTEEVSELKYLGFIISETLVTPESDATLTDNATGSSNYAAKGAHRLKITLTLSQYLVRRPPKKATILVFQRKMMQACHLFVVVKS